MIKGIWRLWTFVLVVIAIGIGFVLFRSGLFVRDKPVVINGIIAPPLPTLVPEQIALGQTVYAQSCASCHGANLEGKPNWKVPLADGSLPPPPHDSTGHTWHHPDELLIDITANGGDPKYNSQMPAFKDQLSSEQIAAVLEFIKSRWGREEREYQWWMTTVGSQQ
jgi:mono/diheme cytochrome c family protein